VMTLAVVSGTISGLLLGRTLRLLTLVPRRHEVTIDAHVSP
jgi:hypothetical protein